MNKKAKRRAFFICAAIFVLYVMAGLNLTEKLSMKRVMTEGHEIKAKPMGIAPAVALKERILAPVATATPAAAAAPPKTASLREAPAAREIEVVPAPEPVRVKAEAAPAPEPAKAPAAEPAGVRPLASPSKAPEPKPAPSVKPEPVAPPSLPPVTALIRDNVAAEPGVLIAMPIVCYALRAGLVDREGLILIKKGGYNTPSWKKPLDILKDRDEEGLKSISKSIGKKQIIAFLRKEGVLQKEEGLTDDPILGRGYGVEKKKLLGLYDRHVSTDYQKYLPLYLDGIGITKGRNGFEIVRQKDAVKERRDEGEEWMMPNLTNLTIRDAIAKLSPRTSRIQVFGSGVVTDQQPKPFQRSRGEVECIIYGRTNR